MVQLYGPWCKLALSSMHFWLPVRKFTCIQDVSMNNVWDASCKFSKINIRVRVAQLKYSKFNPKPSHRFEILTINNGLGLGLFNHVVHYTSMLQISVCAGRKTARNKPRTCCDIRVRCYCSH